MYTNRIREIYTKGAELSPPKNDQIIWHINTYFSINWYIIRYIVICTTVTVLISAALLSIGLFLVAFGGSTLEINYSALTTGALFRSNISTYFKNNGNINSISSTTSYYTNNNGADFTLPSTATFKQMIHYI